MPSARWRALAAASGHKVVISTGDKDLAQLVTPEVTLINTMAKPPEMLDVEGVKAKFGVPPSAIVDYLTLVGDTVDNVPGVEKVGPKTAVKWLAEYGSLDGVVAAAPGIKGAIGENLRKALDWLPTGRKLVTVVTDCDLSAQVPGWPGLDALALREVDRPGLLDFFVRYGFRSWRKELEEGAGRTRRPPRRPARRRAPRCRASTRPCSTGSASSTGCSTSPRPSWWRWTPRPIRSTACARTSSASRLPRSPASPPTCRWPRLPRRARAAAARRGAGAADALAAGRRPRQARPEHQVRPACLCQPRHRRAGLPPRHPAAELRARSAQAARPGKPGRAPPRPQGPELRRPVRQGRTPDPLRQVDIDQAADVLRRRQRDDAAGAPDAVAAARGRGRAALRLRTHRDAHLPGAAAHRAQRRADRRAAAGAAEQGPGRTHGGAGEQAYALAGQPFNLGSPKQIGEILFGKLGLPVVKKTASGAPSTDEEVLEKLAEDHPLPQVHARAPQPGQAEEHLHRQAAADGQPGHRPRAHQLCAGGGRHRAAGQQRAEPAEHPHPHGRGPARARGLRRAAGPRDPVGRLLADRAADHGAHQRRRGHEARLRRRRGHPPRHRGRGLRRAAGRGRPGAAALCQDHQLRPDLRHGRLRPGAVRWASSRRRPATTSTATSRALPACGAGWTRPRRSAAERGYVETLFGRRIASARDPRRQRPAPHAAPSARPSTRRCRAPRPT